MSFGNQCEAMRKDGEQCEARAFALVEIRNKEGGIECVGWYCANHQHQKRKRGWIVTLLQKWKKQ